MSYSFYESQKKNPTQNANMSFLKRIFNRYVRLTPIYMFVLLMAGSVSTFHNDTSVFYQNDDNEANCKKYWWRNLLYIQNLWPISEMCMTWSWYVATDFQLYFVACLLHLVYLK